MPEGVEELSFNFWTANTRSGCLGNIKKCVNNLSQPHEVNGGQDVSFWRLFDRTETGACVAVQTLPFGSHQNMELFELNRWHIGPLFMKCKDLNYFACEMKGRRRNLIDETDLVVSIENSEEESVLITNTKEKIHFLKIMNHFECSRKVH